MAISDIEQTLDDEVVGSLVSIIHAVWNGVDAFDRTEMALLTKDDLTLTVDEDEEELNLASQRRTRRYRTFNTVTFEASAPIDTNMEQLGLLGLVDTTDAGRLTAGRGPRSISESDGEFLEVAFFDEEDLTLAESEMHWRLVDVEAMSPEIDPSETPPIASWEWIVHGAVYLDYDPADDTDPTA